MHRAAHRRDPPWRSPWIELARLVLPTACPGCGRADVPLCPDCRARLAGPGRPVGPGATSTPRTWAVAAYEGSVRECLVAWKDHGRHDLGPVVAAALRRAVTAALAEVPVEAGPVLLVPAPSARAAVRRRGADLLALAAQDVAGTLRRSGRAVTAAAALRPRRRVADQAGLSATTRSANVAGAFTATGVGVAGATCVLLDDVVTTGSTLREGTRALEAAGGHVAAAAVVAVTRLRRPGPAGRAGLSVAAPVD